MIFELNPLKWGKAAPKPIDVHRPDFALAVDEYSKLHIQPDIKIPGLNAPYRASNITLAVQEKPMANEFVSFLETVGKDFMKGLNWFLTYAVPVESLVKLLFPAATKDVTAIQNAAQFIQTAVMQVEQKYAALGTQNGTGAQKLAEVLSLTQAVVTQQLAAAGIAATPAYITSLINAVVAILNVNPAPAAS